MLFLNETAGAILEVLVRGGDNDEVVQGLCQRYEVTPDTARRKGICAARKRLGVPTDEETQRAAERLAEQRRRFGSRLAIPADLPVRNYSSEEWSEFKAEMLRRRLARGGTP